MQGEGKEEKEKKPAMLSGQSSSLVEMTYRTRVAWPVVIRCQQIDQSPT